jgi:hypothetical protein
MIKINKRAIILLTVLLVLSNNLAFSQNVSTIPIRDLSFGIKSFDLEWESPWFRDLEYLGGKGIYIYSNDYESNGIVKLSSDGIKLWDRYKKTDWPVNGFFVDRNGNVFTGYMNSLWDDRSYLVKYDSNGISSEIEMKIEKEIGDAEVDYKYHYPLGIWGAKNLDRVYFGMYYEWLVHYPNEENRYEYIYGVMVNCYNSNTNELIFTKDYPGNDFFGGDNFWDTAVMIKGDENGEIYLVKITDNTNLTIEKLDSDLNNRNIIFSQTIPYLEWSNIQWLKLGTNRIVIDYVIETLVITKGGSVLYSVPNINNEPLSISLDGEGNLYRVENAYISKYKSNDGSLIWRYSEDFENHGFTYLTFTDEDKRLYTIGDFYESPPDKWYYYITRYVQPSEEPKKYSITADTFTPKIAYVNEYTEPLISTVTIYGTTNPVSEIGVNFSISTYPIGAVGQELTIISTRTNPNGEAITQLKLGNIPAEYGVTATCSDCVPEFSSVTFICCGKLPNDHFSQSHVPAWSYNCYANNNCQINPNATIGWRGCALTSLATLINYYANTYPELHIPTTNPGSLNDYLRNLPIPLGYNARNDVNFSAIERYSNGRVNFIDDESVNIWDAGITRQILIDRTNYEILAGRPVILRIRRLRENGTYGPHFIMAIGRCGSSYVVVDPMGGVERLYNPTDPNALLQGIRVFRP